MSQRISPSKPTSRTRISQRPLRSEEGSASTGAKIAGAQWSASAEGAFEGSQRRSNRMVHKLVTAVLITASLATAACNTVRGAAKDVNSAANAVDNAT